MPVLAIDAGTTGVTALVVGEDGGVLSRGYREFAQLFPRPGWVEHEPDDIWTATVAACREALAGTEEQPTCVGITDQRETAVVWDRRTLHSPRPAIVWQDRRTTGICDRLRDDGVEPRVAELTGLRLDPYFTGTKFAWLAEHEPRVWSGVRDGALALGTVDSYVIARLTGGGRARHRPEQRQPHAAVRPGAGRLVRRAVRAVRRPPVGAAGGGAQLGRRRHHRPRRVPRPVAARSRASPVTSRRRCSGRPATPPAMSKCTYGTGSFVLTNTGSTPVRSDAGLLTTVAWDIGDGLVYALEGSIFVTGAAVQWLRDGLGLIDSAAEIEGLARTVPDSGDVVFVPALTGMGAPHWDPHARGAIVGITRGTTRAHLARATLEAIAFEVRDVVDVMVDGGRAVGAGAVGRRRRERQRPADAAAGRPARRPGAPAEGHRDDGARRGVPRRARHRGVGRAPTSWRQTWALDRRFEPEEGRRDDGRHDRWRDALPRAGNWTQ